jgi:hypothetical protein
MSREIEDRLRAALSAKAEKIGEADLRPAQLPTEPARRTHTARRFRRSLPWLAPALAAAAVVGIVVVVTGGPSDRHSSSNSSAASGSAASHAPPVTTPAPAKSSTAPVPPATDFGSERDASSHSASGITVPGANGADSLKLLPNAVLGSPAFWPAGNTRGFGAAHPSELNTNGDPSGIVLGITWHDWGSSTATGIGKTYLPKPGGGYSPGTVPIELRATSLGRCGSVAGYQQLLYRVPTQPGGQPTGAWQLWANATNLCQSR